MRERITIASRKPGFHWAGHSWGTEPVVVEIGDGEPENAKVRISEAQHAELKRQCSFPLYPLRIGNVDSAVENIAAARGELDKVRADIESERRSLDELKAERTKTDKALTSARARFKEIERKLQETQAQLQAAESRATVAESTQVEFEVESKPDPNRERN